MQVYQHSMVTSIPLPLVWLQCLKMEVGIYLWTYDALVYLITTLNHMEIGPCIEIFFGDEMIRPLMWRPILWAKDNVSNKTLDELFSTIGCRSVS